MELEVDVLEFRVPTENNKTLFVWDILPDHSEAYVYVSVLTRRSNLFHVSFPMHKLSSLGRHKTLQLSVFKRTGRYLECFLRLRCSLPCEGVS